MLSFTKLDSEKIQLMIESLQKVEQAMKKPKEGLNAVKSGWVQTQDKGEKMAKTFFTGEAVLVLEAELDSLNKLLVAAKRLIRPTKRALRKAMIVNR